jgi:predicted dehydrogenase
MSYFVAGLGSMGKRRIRCLLANGVDPVSIIGFDHRKDRRDEAAEKYNIKTTENFDQFADTDIKAVIVSLWPHLHVEYLLKVAQACKNWFCEVPLSLNIDGLDELKALTTKNNLLGAIGSQMIFHPASEQLKKQIDENAAGTLVACWGVSTSYFPDWHPYEKMTDYYLADIAQGGANIDIVGHDIQWVLWLLKRKIKSVIATSSKLSNLEFATGSPDTINTLLEFEDGLQFNFHFNGVDKACNRGIWLAGEKTTMTWDLHCPKYKIYDVKQGRWTSYGPDEFEYEQAYVREIKHFISQLDSSSTDWPVKLEDGIQMAKLIAAVNKSILNSNMKVRL